MQYFARQWIEAGKCKFNNEKRNEYWNPSERKAEPRFRRESRCEVGWKVLGVFCPGIKQSIYWIVDFGVKELNLKLDRKIQDYNTTILPAEAGIGMLFASLYSRFITVF